ncbi:hypothetical protein E3J79_00725 [Candidatus Dependentiae bacterium]|nr:MAG: hypothetical protein E3J79_00725 [Candidatus Dependentiae bacterium]
MSKKIVLGILLLIFSTGTINLHASLTEKVATIRQKIKNSIKKVTLNDVLDYTAKAAIVVIGVALIVERRQRKTEIDIIYFSLSNHTFKIFNHENRMDEQEANLDALGRFVGWDKQEKTEADKTQKTASSRSRK